MFLSIILKTIDFISTWVVCARRSHWLLLENMWWSVVWPLLRAKFGRGRRPVNFHLWKEDCWWSAGKTSEEQAVVGVEDSLCVPSLLLLLTFSWGFPSSFNSKHIQNIAWPVEISEDLWTHPNPGANLQSSESQKWHFQKRFEGIIHIHVSLITA